MKTITTQERKILALVSQGYSTSQIAYAIGISPHTVESHRKNLLAKFDAKNSAELILKAIQRKVLNVSNHNHIETLNPMRNENL